MNNSNKYLIIIGLAILALIVSIATYWFINKNENTSDSPIDSVESNTIESKVEKDDLDTATTQESELIIFHNGKGPMCVEAIGFLEENDIKYTEYLTTDEEFQGQLSEYQEKFEGVSKGVSASFGYYPIIFINDNAYSGFNENIESQILNELNLNQ